jgi:hypothetical protein
MSHPLPRLTETELAAIHESARRWIRVEQQRRAREEAKRPVRTIRVADLLDGPTEEYRDASPNAVPVQAFTVGRMVVAPPRAKPMSPDERALAFDDGYIDDDGEPRMG